MAQPYVFQEGMVSLPEGWEDKTVNGFAFPAGAKKPTASFAITRDGSADRAQTLDAYVDRQMVDMARSCPRFELIRRDKVVLGGQPGVQMEFEWQMPDRSIVRQMQSIVKQASGVILTLTATAPRDKFQKHAEAFNHLVESFQFRQ